MEMSFWSKPFGRFIGVLFAISVTGIAMFVIYAGVAIGINAVGFYIRTSDCPDFSIKTFPDECLAHMGDWVRGEDGDGKSDFVWYGAESELKVCIRAINDNAQAEVEAFFSTDAIPAECWDRYGDSERLTGQNTQLEYRGQEIDDSELREYGFVTPTPTP